MTDYENSDSNAESGPDNPMIGFQLLMIRQSKREAYDKMRAAFENLRLGGLGGRPYRECHAVIVRTYRREMGFQDG